MPRIGVADAVWSASEIGGEPLVVECEDLDLWFGGGAVLSEIEFLDAVDEGECGGLEFSADGDAVVLMGEFESVDGGDEVGFVEDADGGFGVEFELFEDGFDGGDLRVNLRV